MVSICSAGRIAHARITRRAMPGWALTFVYFCIWVASANEGDWVFDADEEKQLSRDMVASRAGHVLIHIGIDHGVLRMPDSSISAVRRLTSEVTGARSASEVTVRKAIVEAARVRQARQTPCPVDASTKTCGTWCRAVAPANVVLQGAVSGTPCSAHVQGKESDSKCSCLSIGDSTLWGECRVNCAESFTRQPATPQAQPQKLAPATSTTSTMPTVSSSPTTAAPPKVGKKEPKQAIETETKSSATVATRGRERYLLYDLRHGLDFREQSELVSVAARLVSILNGMGDSNWVLVLPPWCAVVHWYTGENGTKPLPWRSFFDLAGLSQIVPLLEFEDFTRRTGGASVEVAILPAVQGGGQGLSGGRGEFEGWDANLDSCEVNGQQIPESSHNSNGQALVLSGFCDGDVSVKEARCASLRRPSLSALVDMVASVGREKTSVLIKHLEAIAVPKNENVDDTGGDKATRRMRRTLAMSPPPAQELQILGENFIRGTLGNLPYLSVHLRRNDFVRSAPDTTPNALAAAAKLNMLVKSHELEQVFVATDADQQFRETLRRRVKVPLFFFDVDDGAVLPEHPGKVENVAFWVATQAKHFIGSAGAAFSDAVRLHRRRSKATSIRGKTSEEFCPHIRTMEAASVTRLCANGD